MEGPKDEMVGRADFKQLSPANALPEGAGDSSAIERKRLFRAFPAPLALPAPAFPAFEFGSGGGLNGFANEGRDCAVTGCGLGPFQQRCREPDHNGAVRLLVGDLGPAGAALEGL